MITRQSKRHELWPTPALLLTVLLFAQATESSTQNDAVSSRYLKGMLLRIFEDG